MREIVQRDKPPDRVDIIHWDTCLTRHAMVARPSTHPRDTEISTVDMELNMLLDWGMVVGDIVAPNKTNAKPDNDVMKFM